MQQIRVDQRTIQRKRVLKGGMIAYSGRHATLPCVVRDLSDAGARLQVQQGAAVPDTFELLVELDGLAAPCRVVWRKAFEVGVCFLAQPAKQAPRRAQVVSSASPTDKPPLRRPSLEARIGAASATETGAPISVSTPAVAAPALRHPAGAAETSKAPPAARASIPILIADDDPDDCLLIEEAFRDSAFNHPLAFVENGAELLRYLRAEGKYAGRQLPGLILLDLNMPLMDGRTALMHMKADTALRRIPVIVFTTSNAEDDILRTYDLGVSAFIGKPSTYDGLIEITRSLHGFWSNVASLPRG